MAITKEMIRQYCGVHSLDFFDRDDLVRIFGADEVEGLRCAGFERSAMVGNGAPAKVTFSDGGLAAVFIVDADGYRFFTDKYVAVNEDEIRNSIKTGVKLHADG